MLAVVELSSGSSGYFCPICGFELVVVKYVGKKPNEHVLGARVSEGFCGFLGCLRVDLHDKVVDGVDHRGKVFIQPVFHAGHVRKRKRLS
jgi:hypothetical protein